MPKKVVFTIAWWYGAGGVKRQLEVNPGIRKFIESNPDIWSYSDPGITKPQILSLERYNYFLHISYFRDNHKFRRGMILLYKKKSAYS